MGERERGREMKNDEHRDRVQSKGKRRGEDLSSRERATEREEAGSHFF